MVVCKNTSDSCTASEKRKSRDKSESTRIRTEKESDRSLLFREKQEKSLGWVEIDDSGRGSCSDESQVFNSLETPFSASGSKPSPSRGEEEESAYCYAYSNPNLTKPSYSNPNQPKTRCSDPNPNQIPTLPSSNLQTEDGGNIYEEIRPLKKSSRSEEVSRENNGEESAQTDLVLNINPRVLNINPRRSNRQQSYRLVYSDSL